MYNIVCMTRDNARCFEHPLVGPRAQLHSAAIVTRWQPSHNSDITSQSGRSRDSNAREQIALTTPSVTQLIISRSRRTRSYANRTVTHKSHCDVDAPARVRCSRAWRRRESRSSSRRLAKNPDRRRAQQALANVSPEATRRQTAKDAAAS